MHTPHPQPGSLQVLAHACLEDLGELVDAFLAELASMPPYQGGMIPWTELRQDAEASFEMLLRSIGGLPSPERLSTTSEQIGRRRAQAGVPLEVLLRAVRLDFRILWAALLHRAAPDDLEQLVEGAVTVWEAVEQHTLSVHVNYLDEAAVLSREREQERSRIIGQLLNTGGRDPQVLAQVATALEVAPDAHFAVAVGDPEHERTVREAVKRLHSSGITAHIHIEDRRPLLIAEMPPGTREVPAHWLRDVPCGLGPAARGLAAIPRSVRIATEVSRAAGPETDGPKHLRQVWREVVSGRLSDTGTALADEVLAELETTTEHERSRLVETATAYFASGSVTTTAKALFCHRNTVLNRLHRLGEMTGGDLNHPGHAALVQLALHIRGLGTSGGGREGGAAAKSAREPRERS
ncbi:helix-turn-helix domain-containing protein [Salinifilum aidingensis]